MATTKRETFDYKSIATMDRYVEPQKQAAKRHYGSHQFFTKRAWNVVQAYIKNFSRRSDTVLDPYGGSGVTAIEALILERKAINVDISPLSLFLADCVAVSPVDIRALTDCFHLLKAKSEKQLTAWANMKDSVVQQETLKWWYPKDYPLPTNADATYVHQLFSHRQLLSLSFLLSHIQKIKDEQVRRLMLYNFAATMYKCNLTFLSATGRKASRGGSSVFSIYRYKVASKPVELNVWEQFDLRFRKLIDCKAETNDQIGNKYGKPGRWRNLHCSATRLTKAIKPNSVDYIFTDPPYGSHIAYLDLSAMWNAWLGFKPSKQDYADEVIEGGDLKKSTQDYFDLLDKSFAEMFKVLKYDRWLSVVFAHKDPAYWDAVVHSATHHGFQYINTSVQPLNVVWSMHKKKSYLTVVSGEMILNFIKVKSPVTIAITDVGSDVVDIIRNVAELSIVKYDGASTDEVYQDLIPKLLESGLLGEVKQKISDITPILLEQFDYDKPNEVWRVRPNTKLGCSIPLENRVRFYLLDYLRRVARQGKKATLDDVVQNVLPNLINGEQPTKKTILEELRRVAIPLDDKHWGLSNVNEPQIDLNLDMPKETSLPPIKKPAEELEHDEVILLLARLAKHCKFAPVIGKKERTNLAFGAVLAKESSELALKDMDEHDQRKIEQIDIVWSIKGLPKIAFEVEMSTAITSGLERFACLLTHHPATAGSLVLVAPGSRKKKLTDVLLKSHYVGHPMYMENKVKYLYVGDLVALYNEFAKRNFSDTETARKLLATFLKAPESLK